MREEPVAFIIEHDGTGYGKRKTVVLTEIYDPRRPEFWAGGVPPASHTFTPLYTRSNPPQEERSDPLDRAAGDDNHTQAALSWRRFLASDKDWLADHGRKMGSGVGQQAVERLLIALDHIPADDNHKALVDKLTKLLSDYFSPWGSWKTVWWEMEVGDDEEFSAENLLREIHKRLSAFQSRQEEK